MGTRGAFRAWNLSHTIPSLPPPPRCREAERACNFAPIRGRPSPGSPCWATGPPPTELEELRGAPRQSRERRGAPPPPLSAPSLCPRLPVLAQPGAPVIGRAPGVHCVYANQSPVPQVCPTPAGAAAAAGAAVGAAALARAPHCHAPAARRANTSPSRYISAGQGTPGGAEDEGARAWAPADCQPLPSPRPARSPRPPRTRLRHSSSWGCDRGGSCGGARRASA